MSKKDKSKFRKRIKAQISKEISQTQPNPVAPQIKKSSQPQTAVLSDKMSSTTPEASIATKNEALDYTKKDLKKSAIIIGSMIILLVALSIVDNKTGILLRAGNQIFKVLHIGS
ncbi:MAG: hypothetical protein WCV58_01125 [Patescibacteria group bacterium]|jgi:hypothetical protein